MEYLRYPPHTEAVREALTTRYALSNYNRVMLTARQNNVLGYWDTANAERIYVHLSQNLNLKGAPMEGMISHWTYSLIQDWRPDLEWFGCWELGATHLPFSAAHYNIPKRMAAAIEGAYENPELIAKATREPQLVDMAYIVHDVHGPLYYYCWAGVYKEGKCTGEPKGLPKFIVLALPFEVHPSQYRFLDKITKSQRGKRFCYCGPGRSLFMAKLLMFLGDCLEWVNCFADGKVVPKWYELVEHVDLMRPNYEPTIWDRRLAYCRGIKDEFLNTEDVWPGNSQDQWQFDRNALKMIPGCHGFIDDL